MALQSVAKKLLVHAESGRRGIDQETAIGIMGGDGAETGAYTRQEPAVQALVAVGVGVACGKACAREVRWDVEHKGQVRRETKQANEGGNDGAVRTLAVALIGEGGIKEAIADHRETGRERGAERAPDVLGSGREMEQRLRQRIEREGALQQEPPDHLGARCPARLASQQNRPASRGNRLGEKTGLCRFAAAIHPFEGDESGWHGAFNHQTQDA